MKEYMIQSADNVGVLEGRVDHALREGWVCTGGIAIAVVDNGLFFFQATTRDLPGEAETAAKPTHLRAVQ